MALTKLLLITILIIGVFGQPSFGQIGRLKIVGEVKDSLTNEPLTFVHVKLKEETIGVPSNSEGRFVLHLTEEMVSDSLVISLIGYSSKTVGIQSLLSKKFHTFFLHEDTTYLDAVVVRALDANDIVMEVSKRLKVNFPIDPFEFEGYYRNSYSEFNKYVRQFETAFSGFDGNFHSRNGHSLKMLKKKESVDYRQFKWRQNQGNIPWHYLWHIRRQHLHFFTKNQYLKYHCEVEDIDYFDGEKVYKLVFVLKDQSNQTGESWAFVRAKDYAILEIGGNSSILAPKRFKLNEDLFMAFTGSNVVVKYAEYNGKMYPFYSRSLYHHFVYNAQSVRQGNLDMNEEMIIHKITTPTDFFTKKDFVDSLEKRLLALPADSVFWKEYNRPVETVLSKAIQKDLEERKQSMQHQE